MDASFLLSILDDVDALAERGSFASASKRFGEFKLDEERLMRESRELARRCAQRYGWQMLLEAHNHLSATIQAVSDSLSRWDADGARAQLGILRSELSDAE